jgi:hypothetical protein
MSENFVISTMTWSFSRLNAFYHCRYAWYLQYYECIKGCENFFSQYGKFMHKILEMYAKNEISVFEISQYYEDHFYDEVTEYAPNNKFVDLSQSYYDKGLDFLNNLDLDLSKYKILGVEKKIEFELFGKPFVVYVDLILEDENGDIICFDHKSASIKFLKDGSISKKDMEHIEEFIKQLYLYSYGIYKEFNKFPSKLRWNLFRDKKYYEIPFEIKGLKNTLKWVYRTIKEINNEQLWLPDNSKTFYCNNICNFRNSACEYKQQYAGGDDQEC